MYDDPHNCALERFFSFPADGLTVSPRQLSIYRCQLRRASCSPFYAQGSAMLQTTQLLLTKANVHTDLVLYSWLDLVDTWVSSLVVAILRT